ncbi:unnamed protein product [Lasius platythorax]
MVKTCCICGFEQSAMSPDLVFHSIPKDPVICKQWLKVLKKENGKGLLVCSKHFKPEDYRQYCKKPLLKKDVIPRLFFPEISTGNDQMDEPINDMDSLEKSKEIASENSDFIRTSTVKSATESTVETSTPSTSVEETDRITGNLKRKNDSLNGSSTAAKKRCYFMNGVTLRKEEFETETSWNKFLETVKIMRQEKMSLQFKNDRLISQIKTFKDTIKYLKRKNLVTDSVENILNVSLKIYHNK